MQLLLSTQVCSMYAIIRHQKKGLTRAQAHVQVAEVATLRIAEVAVTLAAAEVASDNYCVFLLM
jgi:hypothetical protein